MCNLLQALHENVVTSGRCLKTLKYFQGFHDITKTMRPFLLSQDAQELSAAGSVGGGGGGGREGGRGGGGMGCKLKKCV